MFGRKSKPEGPIDFLIAGWAIRENSMRAPGTTPDLW